MDYFMLIVFMIAVAINGQILPKNPLETNILNYLTKLQDSSMQQNLLASLSLIKIPPVEYYYDDKGIKFDYSIGEMQLTGFNRFTIENLYAFENTSEVSLTLRFPVLTLVSENYKLKGWAFYVYPLKGAGKMKLILRDLVVMTVIRFGTSDGNSTVIEDFLLNFAVKQVEADLQNSSWPINNILNHDGAQILASYYNTIVKELWNHAVPIANNYLTEVSPSQLSQIIKNLSTTN